MRERETDRVVVRAKGTQPHGRRLTLRGAVMDA